MSISFRKINSMISDEIDHFSDLSKRQKCVLREACEKIYMLESSIEQASSQQTISDIKGEVARRADSFLESEK